ncbi:MAG: methyl-accepting chemotaxis protein [Lachnospiraceae bacterium]|nr:methyl-accepting chemotaxis protein [Lachnospiraceae bacterium]
MKEKVTKSKNTNQEVKLFNSLKFKMVGIIVNVVILSIICVMVQTVTSSSSALTMMTQDYMADLALAYGNTVEMQMEMVWPEVINDYDRMAATIGGAHVKSAETSYAYLVSKDGKMLYHPTKEKVGEPVENAVVSGIVEQLKQGQTVEPDIVEYDFKGVAKYAAYYVNEDADFILVVTADKSDVLSPVTDMTSGAIMIGVIVTIFCSTIGLIFALMIVKPILRITQSVRKMADMDFTPDEMQDKMDARKDETGVMSRAISTLRKQLAGVAIDIKSQSAVLKDASTTLSTSATETANTVGQVEKAVSEIADGAGSQAEETQKATENIIIMGNMVEETTHEVRELHNNANIMKDSSEEATKTLEELNAINERTRESIDIIYEQTNTTNESANKIKEATTLIAEIAEETNLLSLNASIEAARAGDQGRGFAVVAAQIQKLAEQSNDSARQIESIIDLLITDSEKAVETMEEVKDIIKEQSEKVVKTGEIFTEVKTRIDASIVSVSNIMDKTEQMDTARVNVVDVVQNLTAIAEENAASTEQTSASVTEVGSIVDNISENAERLSSIAGSLDERMDIFKI